MSGKRKIIQDEDICNIETNFLSNSPSARLLTTTTDTVKNVTAAANKKGKKAKNTTRRTTSKKRQPTKNVKEKKTSKPASPVPEPPASLVNLLRKDKNVFDYFTALQQSLDRDVEKWKEKAMDCMAELRELRKRKIDKDDSKNDNGRSDNDQLPLRTIHVSNSEKGGVDDDRSSLESHTSKSHGCDYRSEKEVRRKNTRLQLSGLNEADNHHQRGKRSLKRKPIFEGGGDHTHSHDNDIGTNNKLCETKFLHSKNLKLHRNETVDEMEEVPFTDELAKELLDMSSSSSSHSSHRSRIKNFEATDCHSENREAHRREIRRNIFNNLTEAYTNLQKLGVWLVDVDTNIIDENLESSIELIHDNKFLNDEDPSLEENIESSLEDLTKSRKESCTNGDNSDITTQFENTSYSITRRTDTAVITDLMRSIRSFVRLPASGMNSVDIAVSCFQPFLGSDLIPCCYSWHANQRTLNKDENSTDNLEGITLTDGQNSLINEIQHPAANCFLLLCRSLMIIDTYASPSSPFVMEGEWEKLFEEALKSSKVDGDGEQLFQKGEKVEQISIGMRNRNITSMLMQSIDGEICRHWAVADRALRETTTVLIDEESDEGTHYSSSESNSGTGALSGGEDSLTPNRDTISFSSKSLNRLYSLAERICHARLLSNLYQYRNDVQEAGRVVIEYILSTCPSPTIEDYPKYPPIMSMCILEALLSQNIEGITTPKVDANSTSISWFFNFLQGLVNTPLSSGTAVDPNESILAISLMLNINAAASVWQERLSSEDKRVRDISRVEIAAYKRLLTSESEWLQHHKSKQTHTSNGQLVEKAQEVLLPNRSERNASCMDMHVNGLNGKIIDACLSIQSSILQMGDHTLAVNICKDALSRYDEACKWNEYFTHTLPPLIVSCFKVYTDLQCRNWELYKLRVFETGERDSGQMTFCEEKWDYNISSEVDKMIEMLNDQYLIEDKKTTQSARILPISTMLRCCLILGDAIRANCIIKLSLRIPSKIKDTRVDGLRMIIDIGEYPSVRVINLSSRQDRWNNFMIQAQNEQLLVVRAVATLTENIEEIAHENEQLYWGSHAYDGTNVGQLGFEKRMQPYLGSKHVMTDLVATHWSPKVLKAFDSFARDDVEQVLLSPSERACALSHLASWYGVKRSLYCNFENTSGLWRKDFHLLRMLKISGFASGSSIFLENSNTPPVPVCVILEDDAVLVDRFSDRLALLLSELPRDFHFCSLGYGRPKNAPMIQYSTNLGIPTCVWYLTGYVLSLAGADYLLNSLPIKGPVDSWIGMKMMKTWDNSLGNQIGFAANGKVLVDRDKLPNRRNLEKIMKFRCFAALTPLCSQKVGASSSTTTTDKNRWRHRDTDIVFSGHGGTRI